MLELLGGLIIISLQLTVESTMSSNLETPIPAVVVKQKIATLEIPVLCTVLS